MRKITRRSFLAAAAACGAAAALSACGGSSASSTAASVSAAADGQKFTVGICQLVQHAALDAATQGFEDALTATLPSTSRMHRATPQPALPSPTALFLPVWI